MRQYMRACENFPDFVFSPFDNPELNWQDKKEAEKGKPFRVLVKRSLGSLELFHNVPLHTSKLLPKDRRKQNEDNPAELQNAVEWLTGGEDGMRCEETDIYGIVELKVDLDVGSAIVDIAGIAQGSSPEKAQKTYDEMRRELFSQTQSAMQDARKLADERVMRQMRITHKNLMQSYERLKTEGHGRYTPSITEAVGAHVLKQELSKSSEARRKMLEEMDEIMKTTQIVS
jgi:hypothetical protein